MIRRSQINIGYANVQKKRELNYFCEEARRVVNLFIDQLWDNRDFHNTFVDFKVDTWLSSRMQQCLGKQALAIVKSQRKKKKMTKPIFSKKSFDLDSRFVKIEQDVNSFDMWITLSSLGRKLKIILPGKKHVHFKRYRNWKIKQSIRLRCNEGKYYVDVFFEKDTPNKKERGTSIGVDIGYKKLLTTSEGVVYGVDMESIYIKISRKKQGSNAFNRALVERTNKTNQRVKQLPFSDIQTIVVEDLKNVKKSTKGKLSTSFVNKMQRWSYANVLQKITSLTEEQGVFLIKVDPAYTSQRCSTCGVICASNRKGEIYKCTCGLLIDADVNAAINIQHLGVYSPQASYRKLPKI